MLIWAVFEELGPLGMPMKVVGDNVVLERPLLGSLAEEQGRPLQFRNLWYVKTDKVTATMTCQVYNEATWWLLWGNSW